MKNLMKGVETMKQFEIGVTTYTDNGNGYYYMTVNGQNKTRIKKAEFEEALAEYELEEAIAEAQEEAEEHALDIEAEENALVQGKAKEEAEEGLYIKSTYDGDTTAYLVMDGTKRISSHWTKQEAVDAFNALAAKKKSKRTYKKRLPKSIGFRETYEEFDNAEVILTEKQVDFLKHLPDTCFWEQDVDSVIWVDVLCDEIGGQFKNSPMTVGAMISTICEKGLGVRAKEKVNGKRATSFKLTPLGKEVALDLGL